jgi:hypothetical protein
VIHLLNLFLCWHIFVHFDVLQGFFPLVNEILIWEKMVFCNWHCNLIFELQKTLATQCIYTLWMLMDKLNELQSCNSPYIWCISLELNCNLIKTIHFQLLCNSIIIAPMMSCWRHWLLSIY